MNEQAGMPSLSWTERDGGLTCLKGGKLGLKVRSVAGLVMQASSNLVKVDILEPSRFPCRGVDIFLHQHKTGAADDEGNCNIKLQRIFPDVVYSFDLCQRRSKILLFVIC